MFTPLAFEKVSLSEPVRGWDLLALLELAHSRDETWMPTINEALYDGLVFRIGTCSNEQLPSPTDARYDACLWDHELAQSTVIIPVNPILTDEEGNQRVRLLTRNDVYISPGITYETVYVCSLQRSDLTPQPDVVTAEKFTLYLAKRLMQHSEQVCA